LARTLSTCDRFAEADAVLELEERESERMGTPWSQPLWHYYRAELLLATGRVDDAAAEAESGVRISEQLNALALDVPLLALLSQISLYRGDLQSARRYVTRAEQLVEGGVGVALCTVAWPRALLEEADGNSEGVAACLVKICLELPTQSQLLIQERRAAARLVHWAHRSKDRASAELVVSASHKLADSNPAVASFRAAALHAEGICLGDLDVLSRSVAEYQRCPRPLDRAAALEDAGRMAIESGNAELGVPLLREAFDHYDLSGCTREAHQVQLSLRGQPHGRSGPQRMMREPTVLTGSEVRVVELVVEGLTNREVAARLYLSPHTVDSHLRHSFTKLGLRSRVELTREVLRRPELLRIP
jgi:DNA-binding CsgD family transcriptional regulator